MSKRVYLLSKARVFALENVVGRYDHEQQLNIYAGSAAGIPLVTLEGNSQTESKTMQAPGDDDPDPEDEGCY